VVQYCLKVACTNRAMAQVLYTVFVWRRDSALSLPEYIRISR